MVRCWQVRIDPTRKCVHVNLVKKSNVPGEEEYLFAPCETAIARSDTAFVSLTLRRINADSAFTVLSTSWNAGTTAAPHEIELLAAADNREEPEDLPLAPWS